MRLFVVVLAVLVGCVNDKIVDAEDPVDTEDSAAPDSGEESREDLDGDGYADDCDDNNPDVFPGNAETCDGLDNDCNGQIDDNAIDGRLFYADADSDGFGDPNDSV
ncbi:MAG: putative metal-binding motif-containing protein, partial [Myxococcota bacterium]|nr:putative metal-binding motif-containing protein [Myxococcota bacterium]